MSPRNNQFLQWFRESSPYIQKHRGKVFVVAFDFKLLGSEQMTPLIQDLSLLNALGIRLVVVMGVDAPGHAEAAIGPINAAALHDLLAQAGVARAEFEAQCSCALTQGSIIQAPVAVSGGNFVTAKPVGIVEGVDHLAAGAVRSLATAQIQALLQQNNLVLQMPFGYSPSGQVYWLPWRSLAGELAVALKAEKLLILRDHHLSEQLVDSCDLEQLKALLPSMTQQDQVDLQALASACQAGVKRAHLLRSDALLQELFTRRGCGVMIQSGGANRLRQAELKDLDPLLDLIRPLEASGALKPRSRQDLQDQLACFYILEADQAFAGCCGLVPLVSEPGDSPSGEVVCVAIHPDYRNDSRAAWLLAEIETIAQAQGIETLFVLTTQAVEWFKEQGFEVCEMAALPAQRRSAIDVSRGSQVLQKSILATT